MNWLYASAYCFAASVRNSSGTTTASATADAADCFFCAAEPLHLAALQAHPGMV